MARAQVRLDPDVAEALLAKVTASQSLSAVANAELRRALQLGAETGTPTPRGPDPTKPSERGQASIVAPQRRQVQPARILRR